MLETWILSGVIVILFIVLFYIVFKVFKSENRRIKWIDNVGIGDTCRLSLTENNINDAKIVNISNDNIITVEFKINKRWIYPPKK
jgi:hypothetical protein